jgi:hypothetical protein
VAIKTVPALTVVTMLTGQLGEAEHRAGTVLDVTDGDQVLVLSDFDALATVSTGMATPTAIGWDPRTS